MTNLSYSSLLPAYHLCLVQTSLLIFGLCSDARFAMCSNKYNRRDVQTQTKVSLILWIRERYIVLLFIHSSFIQYITGYLQSWRAGVSCSLEASQMSLGTRRGTI